tara:strand:- start:79052 stop:79309 length:258 start_codon:yes stop_codon:yes gene_type:complete
MEITLIKVKTSLIITPINNISFETKKVIDQELLEEIVVDIDTTIPVFNLLIQQLETVGVNDLKEQHHWYFKNDRLYKIVHIIKDK